MPTLFESVLELSYVYSKLVSVSVERIVAFHYKLPSPVVSKYYVFGLHDNYLIECASERYIFRVYRNDWRTEEEARFELELLEHLGKKRAPAAVPIRTKTDDLMVSLSYPEGTRAAALFLFADGKAPGNALTSDDAARLGRAVATIHCCSDTFCTRRSRPVLDLPYLLDRSVAVIKSHLDKVSLDYLTRLGRQINRTFVPIQHEPGVFGPCIGDINGTNFHVTEAGRITLFDFDQCGFGDRAFDIAKFFSSISAREDKALIKNAFISSYEQVRKLTFGENESLRSFEIVALIWVMAIHVDNADRVGYKLLEKPFWDRRLNALKALSVAFD